MAKRELWELQSMQAAPLSVKIRLTQQRIREWVDEYGEDGVYVSFSGGKDSTVLLDIARKLYPDIKAMFVDVPTQYPELRDFVNTYENVDIVKPKISFMEVCEKYGFPLISKEVSECVHGARKYLTKIMAENNALTNKRTPSTVNFQKPLVKQIIEQSQISLGVGTITSIENSEELASILNERMKHKSGGNNQRLAIMLGWLTKDKENPIKANIPSKDRSNFSQEKYKFFLEAPFEISNQCCNVMKKNPAHNYFKETGRKPIIATMAAESRLRTQKWIQNGCNGFNLRIPTSTPMSFWTEQDVLLYIKQNNLPICSVYGNIIEDIVGTDQVEGQMTISDLEGMESMGIFDAERLPLKTTGCNRTGCMLCGFGCHLEKEGESRFELLKETHPGMYKLLDVVKNNGVTFREAIDWINEHGNLHIKY